MSEQELNNDRQNQGFGDEIKSFFWETFKVVFLALIIILPIRYYVMQPFFVKGASMEPNFEDGDYLLIDELSYQFGNPERGDVIVFRYPLDHRQLFIKRVIALPAETVEIKENMVKIYNKQNPGGFVLKEPYLEPNQKTIGNMVVKLDDNEYFVLGDNRLESSASRRWGAVNKSLITGRAFIRPWPVSKISKIPDVAY